jgi:hypothetical protein
LPSSVVWLTYEGFRRTVDTVLKPPVNDASPLLLD